MQYLKINALLIELWDEYRPEFIPILLKENNLQGDWSLLKFEQLSSEDKIRALELRLKDTERQLSQWREISLKARTQRNRIPPVVLRDYGSAHRPITQL